MFGCHLQHACGLVPHARPAPTAGAAAAVPAWNQRQRGLHFLQQYDRQSGCQQQQWSGHMQQQYHNQRGRLLQQRAGPVDAAPAWTLDQIAGLAFGAVMLAFYFGSKQVDVFIAKQQRKQLGLCEQCGGLNDPATCSQGSCPMKSKPL